MAEPVPLPSYDPIAKPRDWQKYASPRERDPREGFATDPWLRYLTSAEQRVSLTPIRATIVELSGQTATLPAVPFNLGVPAAGLYRVTHYLTPTIVSGGANTLALTLSWTHGGQTKSWTSSTYAVTLPTQAFSGQTMLRLDSAAPITWAITYVTAGSPAMVYTAILHVEKLG